MGVKLMADRQATPATSPAGVVFDDPNIGGAPLGDPATRSGLFLWVEDRNAWVLNRTDFDGRRYPTVIIINVPEEIVQDFEDQILGTRRYQGNSIFENYFALLHLEQGEFSDDVPPEFYSNGNQVVLIDGRLTNDGYQGLNDAIDGYVDAADFADIFQSGDLNSVDLTGIDRVPRVSSGASPLPEDWTADDVADYATLHIKLDFSLEVQVNNTSELNSLGAYARDGSNAVTAYKISGTNYSFRAESFNDQFFVDKYGLRTISDFYLVTRYHETQLHSILSPFRGVDRSLFEATTSSDPALLGEVYSFGGHPGVFERLLDPSQGGPLQITITDVRNDPLYV
ncbi:MAG: hypothetical protein HC869_23135, partial [Rhodospirillales bacterium]|nr:hypothetical protein [Rhodospirillales bacterium]